MALLEKKVCSDSDLLPGDLFDAIKFTQDDWVSLKTMYFMPF